MPPLSLVYGLYLTNPQYRSKHETLHNTATKQIKKLLANRSI